MNYPRTAGVLLHPTSFPGSFGIGELGPEAYRFIDFLERAEQQTWQVCPLGPTSFGDSPYQCFSAFAGNPLLISIKRLKLDGWVKDEDFAGMPSFPRDQVDFGGVIPWKYVLLDKAFERWSTGASEEEKKRFKEFRKQEANWLEDFSLFMALKDENHGAPWNLWDKDLAQRKGTALKEARKRLERSVERHEWNQFFFFRHWEELRAYANKKGIRVIGDIPIFVAYDSSDVWSNPELFYLDKKGNPTVVAGVPPDYFSPTGQRWGNPLYRWDVMKERDYDWWVQRFSQMFQLVDIVRLDHFRGFEAYWEIPASEETAVKGKWIDGPGIDLFRTLKKEIGEKPIIAEDLGVITPDVELLLEASGFPGMKVLQFAFDGEPENVYLPHNFPRDTVVYTATHDNDTCEGWFRTLPEKDRLCYQRYTGFTKCSVHWQMMRLAYASVGHTAIAPLQDILGLGSEARMNTPGRPEGNWSWRYDEARLDDGLAHAMAEMVRTYGRGRPVPKKKTKK